ncbi:MAG: flagellar hook-basal body complex protein FliE [Verrucomicrobia bacterium]|jgi:flagellar hook-basal body complex protein FliE|nr:flagellar hook-basal body complex protein FliE [Verrucomicrobiota bacterium]
MSPLGSINPIAAGALQRVDAPLPKISLPVATPTATPSTGFGQMLDGLVAAVDTKQQTAAALTREVLLGDTGQVHQSMIAMQEAGVAFSMMVEVRNKLVESYQELMRMQV